MTESVALSLDDARKAVREAIRRELEDRSYDNHAYDREIWAETLDDTTEQVLKALKYA